MNPTYTSNVVDENRFVDLLRTLYSKNLNFKVKMGLENMILFNQKLGNPANQITTIHVTGTNGKGSVVYKIAKALQASGYKTGMYVSPHISSFRERITINGEMISEEDVVKNLQLINEIKPTLPTSLSFFESVTGMAFNYFREKQVDVAVIEVGLGGRLDSTNIITPELSVITSIGLDHQGILGNTITDIAREKAGIIKDNKPVVVGPNCPHQQIYNIAGSHHSPYVPVMVPNYQEETYDAINTAIACQALRTLNEYSHGKFHVPEDVILSATKERPICRFEEFTLPNSRGEQVKVILDVCHNQPGFHAMYATMKKLYGDRTIRVRKM